MSDPQKEQYGVLGLAWKRYLHSLNTKPLRTKALTSASLSALSDILAQLLTTRRVYWRRTVAFALYGGLWSGPANHYWQNFLQRLFKGRSDPTAVVQKVILENLTISPFHNALMMSFISLIIEGRSVRATKEKLRRDFPPLIINAWRVWPLASLINYRYVPLHLRVPFVSVLALCWSTFLIVSSKRDPAIFLERHGHLLDVTDYREIDANETLDDDWLKVAGQDAEDRYFDAD
ncbi:hypothetical protein WJX84_010505 [Apatococcus fuscideae]|uniref:CCD97-like C-terminal domain-containing protein n=1 Tax=Apatococcus fuscideae TaxID=2026836 RepID=A0AAW1SD64_9CHLO